jgi:hypothetical protein
MEHFGEFVCRVIIVVELGVESLEAFDQAPYRRTVRRLR